MENGHTRRLGIKGAQAVLQQAKQVNLPQEIVDFEKLMHQQNPNLREAADILAYNPEVMGDFLQLANGVLNRPSDDPIVNVTSALMLMGLQEVHRLFISAYLIKKLPIAQTDEDYLHHSIRCGIANAELSQWVYGLGRSEAYIVGFLQDIGALYLMRYDPEDYKTRYYLPHHQFPISKIKDEEIKYGTNHCYLSNLLVQNWRLGNFLSRAVLFHHHPNPIELKRFDEKLSKMVAVNQISNFLVFETFETKNITKELEDAYENALYYLGLTDRAIDLTRGALEKWGNSKTLPASRFGD